MAQLGVFYDVDLYIDNHAMGAECLASVLFNCLEQITQGPASTGTRATFGDNGFDALRLLREQFGRTNETTDNDFHFGEDRTT